MTKDWNSLEITDNHKVKDSDKFSNMMMSAVNVPDYTISHSTLKTDKILMP